MERNIKDSQNFMHDLKLVEDIVGKSNISSNDIKNILIPMLNKEVEGNIAHLVKESFRLKKESEHLLETAKKAVEMAIEEGEERAMEWVETQA